MTAETENDDIIGGLTIRQFCKKYALSKYQYYQHRSDMPTPVIIGVQRVILFRSIRDWELKKINEAAIAQAQSAGSE